MEKSISDPTRLQSLTYSGRKLELLSSTKNDRGPSDRQGQEWTASNDLALQGSVQKMTGSPRKQGS